MIAAETRAILDLNHDFMLKQMAGTNLDVTKLPAPKTPLRCPRCRPPRRTEAARGRLTRPDSLAGDPGRR